MTARDLYKILDASRQAGLKRFLFHPDPEPGAADWHILTNMCGTPWKENMDGSYWPADTPRSTFNDAKEGALRSKLRNQGSFSFSGKHDAHRSPRPPPTPRGLEALSTPSSQAAGMSHTERLRLMRERRQAAAEKLLHPDVLNPIPDHRRGLMTYQMKMACYGRSR